MCKDKKVRSGGNVYSKRPARLHTYGNHKSSWANGAMEDKKEDHMFGISAVTKVFSVSKGEKDDLKLSKEVDRRGKELFSLEKIT